MLVAQTLTLVASSPQTPLAAQAPLPLPPMAAPTCSPSPLSKKRLWPPEKCPISHSTLSNRPEKIDS
ncbi:hypothetical protein H5410_002955 [Solanum commersonii]|uniref:Uncharacterized protein n=1 Tax=Solanum commersonii TaxID=4109 RepID=A0A9J6B3D0_SOLCO|nr:hypothetical protein H5410_002955 [Solanum commersonii]